MSNIFASNVQKQAFMDGVQDENRTAIPMASVSDVDTENLETMSSRYGNDFAADSTTDGTYAVNDFAMSNDTLSINNQAVYGERIQTKDLVHAGDAWDIVADRVDRHTRALGVAVHRSTYSNTVDGAGIILDNEVLGGGVSAGTPIAVSATNPDEISTKVYALMQDAGVASSQGRPYFMIDPSTARFFKLFGMSAGFNVADRQIMKGFEILPTFDFDYVVTPEIEHEQLTTGSSIIATDVYTVKGVNFTVVASPSAAGDVDLGSDDEETLQNLAAAVNGGAGAGSAYIALTSANRAILKNAGVKATSTATTITVTGYGSLAVVSADSTLVVGDEQKNLLAGLRNSTHLALPSKGFMVDEIDQVPGFTGKELRSTQIYDSTVWTKNKPKICKVVVAV
jgi:hypothetical protein